MCEADGCMGTELRSAAPRSCDACGVPLSANNRDGRGLGIRCGERCGRGRSVGLASTHRTKHRVGLGWLGCDGRGLQLAPRLSGCLVTGADPAVIDARALDLA